MGSLYPSLRLSIHPFWNHLDVHGMFGEKKIVDDMGNIITSVMDPQKTLLLIPKKIPITQEYTISSKVLGLGISGKVLEVINKKDQKKYALKFLPDNPKSRREIELHWKSSICENIVKIKDVFENEKNNQRVLLVVMESMDGGELFERITKKEKLDENEASKIMKDICNAVKFLHDNDIAHRDLKPENLLISRKIGSYEEIVKLTDFGFAKQTKGKTLQTACYTPYYVAPEVFDSRKYDKACDIGLWES